MFTSWQIKGRLRTFSSKAVLCSAIPVEFEELVPMLNTDSPNTMKHTLVNASWIVAGASLQRLMPFLVIPILSRRLGPDSFGEYIAAVALSSIVMQLVEFGFNLTATRKVAELSRTNPKEISRVLGEVIGGRLMIAFALVVFLYIVRSSHQFGIQDPRLFWSCVFMGVTVGSDFRCMFYGKQAVGYLTFYAFGYALLSAFAIIWLVDEPNQMWLAFAVPTLIATTSTGFSLHLLKPEWGAVSITPHKAWEALRESWPAFLQRGMIQINSNINPIILSFFAPSTVVGYFGLAERLLRQAALFALNPAQSTMVPHISSEQFTDAKRATRDFVFVWSSMLAASVVGGIFVFWLAPLISWFFVGTDISAAVLPLKILCLSPALMVINQFGFSLWLYLIDRQRANNVITLVYVFVSICVMTVGSKYAGHIGACFAIVVSQIALVLAYLMYCQINRIAPWQSPLGIVLSNSSRKNNILQKKMVL
jgi:PST family polysaccharide transporter